MAYIEYFGIDPLFGDAAGLINSPKFQAILKANPELSLVTVEEKIEYAKGYRYKVELPLPTDHEENIALIDVDNRHSFMWVINAALSSVEDPRPAFIEILKVMDTHAIETLDSRLFLTQYDDLADEEEQLNEDDPEILAAEYDFTKGEYIL